MPRRGARAPYCEFFVYEGKDFCPWGCVYDFCPKLGKQAIKVVCHKYAQGRCGKGKQCPFGVHEDLWEHGYYYDGSAGGTGGTTGDPNGSYGSSSGSAGGAGGSATRGPVTLAEARENMIQAAIQMLNLDPKPDDLDPKSRKEHFARYQRAFHPDKFHDTVFEPVFQEIEKHVHHMMGK